MERTLVLEVEQKEESRTVNSRVYKISLTVIWRGPQSWRLRKEGGV